MGRNGVAFTKKSGEQWMAKVIPNMYRVGGCTFLCEELCVERLFQQIEDVFFCTRVHQ